MNDDQQTIRELRTAVDQQQQQYDRLFEELMELKRDVRRVERTTRDLENDVRDLERRR